MAGNDEAAFLATRHVEAELLLWGESEEVASEASHFGNKLRIDTVIDDLENTPVLAGLDDLPANLITASPDVIDSFERDDGNIVAELVVGHLGTLILVPDEAGLQSGLAGKGREGGRRHLRYLLLPGTFKFRGGSQAKSLILSGGG